MKRVPPKLLRRAILAPVVLVLDLVLILLSPVLVLLAFLAWPVAGGSRPMRLLLIALAFAVRHLGATLGLFALWVASGFGWKVPSEPMQRAHYRVMSWFVSGVYRAIVRLARVRVVYLDSEEAERALDTHGNPVVMLGRHAGEGDTLLVMHALLCRHRRGPRVVMHERLRLDPLIDVLGDRLPNRFVDPRGGNTEVEIAAMAGELGGTAALVIFPEGANFSEQARQRGIDRLERAGHARQAEQARTMRHLSAPRPGGTLAAIDAAPHADLVLLAHHGFPVGFSEMWRLLPEEQTVEVRMWHEPASAIPDGQEERIDWLFGWWQRLDTWVQERHEAAPGA